jgi:hypothetical protein
LLPVFLGGMLPLALTGDAEARRELPAQVATWSFIALLFSLGWVVQAWPDLSIVPDELGSRIATAMGGRDIEFELES